MSTLLEKALEKVAALPQDEQDAIASQILASIADESAWKARFAEKRDVIRRMAREAIEEDERGKTWPMERPALMQSRTTRRFWRLFSHLPADIQRDAKRSYRLFRTNPAHPGLQFKKLEGEDNIYSVRIGLEYRALAVMNKDRVVRYWVGSHHEYDRLV